MNQTQWLQWRKNGIGGSDAPIIKYGSHFGRTIADLYKEKISEEVKELNVQEVRHGKYFEDQALDWLEKKFDTILFRQVRKQNPEHSWIRATLDGIDVDGEYLVEAKCPMRLENHEHVKKSRKVPDIYYPQLQHQMKADDKVKGAFFLSFNYLDKHDSVILEVPKDEGYINDLVAEEAKFWFCVENRLPPDSMSKDYVQMDNEEWNSACESWKEAKQWSEKEDFYRKEVLRLAQGRNCKGAGVRVSRIDSKGHIDYDAIPELQGVDKESYRKPGYTKWQVLAI